VVETFRFRSRRRVDLFLRRKKEKKGEGASGRKGNEKKPPEGSAKDLVGNWLTVPVGCRDGSLKWQLGGFVPVL